jgi:hypothetical protein
MIKFNRSFLGVPVTEEQIIALNEAYQRKIEVQPMTVRRFKFHKDELKEKAKKSELKPMELRDLISDVVCDILGVNFKDIRGSSRLSANVLPRKLIGYLIGNLTPMSLSAIGEYLGLINSYGSGDHTVILYYKKVIGDLLELKDAKILAWMEEIEGELIRRLSNMESAVIEFQDQKHILSENQKEFIRERYARGARVGELARLCKIHRNTVGKIVNRKRFKV